MNSGDATPLVHCMRIGKSHGDVAIVLLGSFSRWINHLEDDQMALPETKVLLRALSDFLSTYYTGPSLTRRKERILS